MSEWWNKILQDVPTDDVAEVLEKCGAVNSQAGQEWVFETIAQCRLAFASLINTKKQLSSFRLPDKSIISSTVFERPRGRPKTAQWAFWAMFIIQKEIKAQEKELTSKNISSIVELLLSRSFSAEKVRSEFVELRKTADKHGAESAQVLLNGPIGQKLSKNQFKKNITNDFGKVFDPDTDMSPMIKNGKVDDEWVEGLTNLRKSILRRVKRTDILCGLAPVVGITSRTKLFDSIPMKLTQVRNSSKEIGGIHLGKSEEVEVPRSVYEQEDLKGAKVSLKTESSGNGGKISIEFPEYFLSAQDPFMAAVYAVPVWWHEWNEYSIVK